MTSSERTGSSSEPPRTSGTQRPNRPSRWRAATTSSASTPSSSATLGVLVDEGHEVPGPFGQHRPGTELSPELSPGVLHVSPSPSFPLEARMVTRP